MTPEETKDSAAIHADQDKQPAAKTGDDEGEYKLTLISDKSQAKVGFSHYLAIFIWIGWFSFFFYFPVFFVVGMFLCPPVVAVVVVLIVTSAFYPIRDKYQPKWGFELGNWLMRKAEEYFKVRLYFEDYEATNSCGPSIVTIEPHDVLPVGLCSYSNAMNHLYGHKIRGCLASACFSIPGMRHVYTWARATNIERKTMRKLLSTGQSVCICPGGAQEVTYMSAPGSKEIALHLRNRYGFIKMAMQQGCAIVPTFAFNQRKVWDFWVPPFKWLHKLGRKMGFIPLVFFGIGGIPLAQAKSLPIDIVLAKPIKVTKVGEDVEITTEMIQPYLDEFIAVTERMFERNKAKFGMADYKLVIH